MIIDAHMHVKFKGFEAKNIMAYLNKYRVEQCWLLTWEEINPINPKYTHLSVEDVFAAYEKYPSRVIPLYAPDPCAPNFEEKMIKWYQKGIKGCGELKVSLSWNSNEITRLLNSISTLKIPLVFHMEQSRDCFIPNSKFSEHLLAKLFSSSRLLGLPRIMINHITKICPPLKSKRNSMLGHFPGYLCDFMHLEQRLIEFPQVGFIGHGPLFWKGIAADWVYDPSDYPITPIKEEGIVCNLLSKYNNLYADLSGPSGFNAVYRDRTFAKQFLTRHDQKILYGTDNYELGLKDLLRALNLTQRTYHRIYYENAVNLMFSRREA